MTPDPDQHLSRAVACACGWIGITAHLIASNTLQCPRCRSDQISYITAPGSEQKQ